MPGARRRADDPRAARRPRRRPDRAGSATARTCSSRSPQLGEADRHGGRRGLPARATSRRRGRRSTLVRDPREAAAGADVARHRHLGLARPGGTSASTRLRDLEPYRLDEALVALAAPEAIVLHCLPAHPGEEITAERALRRPLGGLGRGREPPARAEGAARAAARRLARTLMDGRPPGRYRPGGSRVHPERHPGHAPGRTARPRGPCDPGARRPGARAAADPEEADRRDPRREALDDHARGRRGARAAVRARVRRPRPGRRRPERAVRLLQEGFARQHRRLPVRFLDENLVQVAVADPANLNTTDELRLALGRQLQHRGRRPRRARGHDRPPLTG